MVHDLGQLRLGELGVQSGRLTEQQLVEGLRQQESSGSRLGQCLLDLGYVTEDGLLELLASQLRIDKIDSSDLRISQEARDALGAEFVRKSEILPLEVVDGTLRIATADPGNRRLIEDVRLLTGLEVEETIASRAEILKKVEVAYQVTVEGMVEDLESSTNGKAQSDNLHDIEVMANEPTVINLVNVIIQTALRERASDIHFVPFEKSLELRYRIDGVLQIVPPPPRHLHAALISRVKIMSQINIAERFIPQDGHFQIRHAGRRVDVRVGTMPTIHGESVVMRLLEKDQGTHTLEELGMDPEEASALGQIVEKPHGIVLSTGPTGCGKTTTLYAILSSIYTPEKKTLTIEDPVEYELPGVAQIPVRPARGFTFATGLRSILRQDPDVIMVGEIRDGETAEIAIRAALTGHLVFSTLHTNDAAGAVTRLLDMGIEAFLISSSLEAVLAQRLVRRICPECKENVPASKDIERKLKTLGLSPDAGPFFRGAGCENCRMTGYRGRIGLFELLVLTPDLRDLILRKRPSTEIKDLARRTMRTVGQDGLLKATQGVTSLDEILRVSISGEDGIREDGIREDGIREDGIREDCGE